MIEKAVLILSGGFDSTTLLYKLIDEGKDVVCLSFNYGQKASKELEYAKRTCNKLNIHHEIFDISSILDMLKWSSLIDPSNKQVEQPQNTVVPSRNTILLELATAYAISNNCDGVYYGAIKGDIGDYPDTTPVFLEQINELNRVNNYQYIPIFAPFIELEKWEVAKIALELNIPLEDSWSCYLGGDEPCGECFSCKTRIEAIQRAKNEMR
jgi:7-cyano-7-deazaguanine synthase